MNRHKPDLAALARQLAAALADQPANDGELTEEDEREIQERAERAVARMRRPRSR